MAFVANADLPVVLDVFAPVALAMDENPLRACLVLDVLFVEIGDARRALGLIRQKLARHRGVLAIRANAD